MDDEIKNEKNENPEWEKHTDGFLNFIKMLKEMNEERERSDAAIHQSNMHIAMLQKSMFDSYVAVGFSEGQALDLTKNMINNLLGSVRPLGDK